jgi:hypothetical protein
MKLDEYEIVSDVGSQDFTDFITNEIQFNWKWIFSNDEKMNSIHYRKEEDRIISDTGMLIQSYDDMKTFNENSEYLKLNCYADYLYQTVLKKSKWEYREVNLRRYYWNYYNVGSSGIFHTDYNKEKISSSENYASILYNFSNDGGTIIEVGDGEIFIPSISEEAIIFNSLANHRGVGPSKSKKRFALNIIFTYSKRTIR